MSINLKVPDLQELKPRITVVGVGGAGGNAVNNMIASGLSGVEFVAANTDAQALTMSVAPTRIQMGVNTTEGLGAGSKADVGREAAQEAESEIRAQIAGSHMVFVAAGMGGGTGTGAAPVIAKIAQDEGVLTVGVVTKPFHFEGGRRMRTADQGLKELRDNVDTLIVIPNQNLFRIANEKTTFAEAFQLADRVLHSGIACITDLIVKDGLINLDFADVRAVMNGMGSAVMGTGQSTGENRAMEAAEEAIANPLLDDVSLTGAKGLLISITGGDDLTLYEVDEAATRIRQEVDPDANIILGAAFDDELEGKIRVSIVASGVQEELRQPEKPVEVPLKNSLAQRLTDASDMQAGESAPMQQGATPQMDQQTVEATTQPVPHEVHESQARQPQQDAAPVSKSNHGVQIKKKPPQLLPSSQRDASEPATGPQHPVQEGEFVPAAPATAPTRPPRMPEVEDFPPHTQQAIAPNTNSPQNQGIQDQKRRLGFFEKLTNVARQKLPNDSFNLTNQSPASSAQQVSSGSQDQPVRAVANGSVNNLNAQDPRQRGGISVRATENPDAGSYTGETSEHIDIPPFLRRNAPKNGR